MLSDVLARMVCNKGKHVYHLLVSRDCGQSEEDAPRLREDQFIVLSLQTSLIAIFELAFAYAFSFSLSLSHGVNCQPQYQTSRTD